MERSDFLLKETQELKNEASTNFSSQSNQQVFKETRFLPSQFTPATAWNNCVGKAQSMLRGSGSGQETAGWIHFHKVATSGHEVYAPPMDMQQVYYQGLPDVRNNCYPLPDPRSQYPATPTSYADIRPPSQVVNQRFIQCVNHFAPGPGSRSMPCLLQPSYYGYEYGGPIQSGSDTLLTRVEPSEASRSQRYPPQHDWSTHQTCYRPNWDSNDQACQSSFFPRYQENQSRKNKNHEGQDQSKNKDKNSASFSYLAAEVSREMHWIVSSGGHTLSDLLEFCKLVQSFLFISTIATSQRSQMIREIVLSFIHISSAYVHISSTLLMAEQSGMTQSEIENLKSSFALWENSATAIVVVLRSLIHSLSDVRIPDHKKMQDNDDQNSLKSDSTSLPNYGFGDSFRFPNAMSRNQRNDYSINQPFEFKRKYQQQNKITSQKDKTLFGNSTLNFHKNGSMNFKAKSCNQLNLHNTVINSSNSKLNSKIRDNICNSPDGSDTDKSIVSEKRGTKTFCFNLLKSEKQTATDKIQDEERQKVLADDANQQNVRPSSNSSKKGKEIKEKKEARTRKNIKLSSTESDLTFECLPAVEINSNNRFNVSSQPKVEDWSFGVLNTGYKTPFPYSSNNDLSKSSDSKLSLFSSPISSSDKDTAEKPMSSDGEGSPKGRFSNPELNKALEEHCEAARTQLKHKMLDILGFLMTNDDDKDSGNEQIAEIKKNLQESLNRISYLVYTDKYRGVAEMMNAVRHLLQKTRIQNLNNSIVVSLADELESSFLDLFKKEFGCCGILYPQSRDG